MTQCCLIIAFLPFYLFILFIKIFEIILFRFLFVLIAISGNIASPVLFSFSTPCQIITPLVELAIWLPNPNPTPNPNHETYQY